MVKFLKTGKVVIVLNGRFAGRKAVVVKNFDDGTEQRPYGHALVAGVDKYPLKITKKIGKKRAAKRSRVRPFLKVVNYNHVLPTRYALDVDLRKVITAESMEKGKRPDARKEVKKIFEERYQSGKNKWFFSKLRF